jgi:hypothetical protein
MSSFSNQSVGNTRRYNNLPGYTNLYVTNAIYVNNELVCPSKYDSTQESISLGPSANRILNSFATVAIGRNAGQSGQGTLSIAIGNQAAETSQKTGAVAIGAFAGNNNQGVNAIAIGTNAGPNFQHNQSIVINATGANVGTINENSCYIAPIRKVEKNRAYDYLCTYNSVSREIGITRSRKFASQVVNGSGYYFNQTDGTYVRIVTKSDPGWFICKVHVMVRTEANRGWGGGAEYVFYGMNIINGGDGQGQGKFISSGTSRYPESVGGAVTDNVVFLTNNASCTVLNGNQASMQLQWWSSGAPSFERGQHSNYVQLEMISFHGYDAIPDYMSVITSIGTQSSFFVEY